jgi:hypothetical protein
MTPELEAPHAATARAGLQSFLLADGSRAVAGPHAGSVDGARGDADAGIAGVSCQPLK